MVLYQPHVKLDAEEAKELRKWFDNPPPNDRAVETLKRARANHPRK